LQIFCLLAGFARQDCALRWGSHLSRQEEGGFSAGAERVPISEGQLMSVSNPIEGDKPPPKRKPIWPWLVILVLALVAIYTHHRISVIINDLAQIARDFVQLLRWVLAKLEG
jgi:hypothetical protein